MKPTTTHSARAVAQSSADAAVWCWSDAASCGVGTDPTARGLYLAAHPADQLVTSTIEAAPFGALVVKRDRMVGASQSSDKELLI